jgi:hypothetical protein
VFAAFAALLCLIPTRNALAQYQQFHRKNRPSDYVLERTDLPNELITRAQGAVMFSEENYLVSCLKIYIHNIIYYFILLLTIIAIV